MLASLRGRPLVRPLLGRAARCCVTTTGGTKAPKLDVLAKAESHGIRLSATERALIERDLGRLGPGEAVTGHEWEILVRERAQRQAERQLLLQYVEKLRFYLKKVVKLKYGVMENKQEVFYILMTA